MLAWVYLMRHKLRWLRRIVALIIVLLATTAALLWYAPASMLAYWLEQQQAPLQLGLTKGSLRNGQAGQAHFNGIDIGKLEWQLGEYKLNPLATRLQFQADGAQMQAQGSLTINQRQLSADALQGYFPAAWMDLSNIAPFLFASGIINFNLTQLDLEPKSLPKVNGNINWQQAGLTGLVTAKLGDLHFSLASQSYAEQQLVVNFNTKGDADIILDGVITSDGRIYQLNTNAKANRRDINDFLQRVGQLQPDRSYQIQFNGKLFPDE